MCLSCSRLEARILCMCGSSSTISTLPIVVPLSLLLGLLAAGAPRQSECEADGFGSIQRKLQSASVRARNVMRNGQPQSRARQLGCEERLENAGHDRFGNRPIPILQIDAHMLVFVLGPQNHHALWG